jgi:hypothetical protein
LSKSVIGRAQTDPTVRARAQTDPSVDSTRRTELKFGTQGNEVTGDLSEIASLTISGGETMEGEMGEMKAKLKAATRTLFVDAAFTEHDGDDIQSTAGDAHETDTRLFEGTEIDGPVPQEKMGMAGTGGEEETEAEAKTGRKTQTPHPSASPGGTFEPFEARAFSAGGERKVGEGREEEGAEDNVNGIDDIRAQQGHNNTEGESEIGDDALLTRPSMLRSATPYHAPNSHDV